MILRQEQKDILAKENSIQAYVWERRKGATTTCALYALKYLKKQNENIYCFSGYDDINLTGLVPEINKSGRHNNPRFTLPGSNSTLYVFPGVVDLTRHRGMEPPTCLIFDNVAFPWPDPISEIPFLLNQATNCLAFQVPEFKFAKDCWWFYLIQAHNKMEKLLTSDAPELRKYAKQWLKNHP